MKKFGISYKHDSTGEFIMKITCDDEETAIKLVADIKQLEEHDVTELFHITEIRVDHENDI